MFKFEIINPPKSFIVKEKIIFSILKEISLLEEKKHFWILNIVFVSNSEIQELNKNYRKIDKSTDVLSFHYYDDFSTLDENEIAWEVILSEEKIIEQGKEYKLWNELEFYKLVIHSSLHILWYDHENDDDYKIMKEKEDFIWNKIFN